MPTYAVIGSNCFMGSHIVDALLATGNDRVIGLSRSPEYKSVFLPYKKRDPSRFQFYQVDSVRQFDLLTRILEEHRPNAVINVAALSEVVLSNHQPVEYFEINTTAVVRLGDYLRRQSFVERLVHISSAEIFGSCDRALDETDLFNPSTPYAVSKAAADMYLFTLQRNFDFPVTIIRSTNVYGAHQQLFKIIPRTMIYLRLGRTVELHGGGKSVKSFIHVRDVVRGLLLALKQGKSGVFHFSVPSERSIAEIVAEICGIMGKDFKQAARSVGERLGQDARYWLRCDKAEKELGWKPEIQFRDGLVEVKDWIESGWDQISKEPLEYSHRV